jgi:hypothetical protein
VGEANTAGGGRDRRNVSPRPCGRYRERPVTVFPEEVSTAVRVPRVTVFSGP